METVQPEKSPPAPGRTWIKVLATIILLSLAVLGYFSMLTPTPSPDVTFINLSGEKIASKSLRGKVLMVNFWATSCTTCLHEMPHMVATYHKFKDRGLAFVAVAMRDDPPNYVLNYTQTRQLPFTVVLDVEGKLATAFGDVKMTPTTFVIDKQGNIIKRYLGEPEFSTLHQLLEKALGS